MHAVVNVVVALALLVPLVILATVGAWLWTTRGGLVLWSVLAALAGLGLGFFWDGVGSARGFAGAFGLAPRGPENLGSALLGFTIFVTLAAGLAAFSAAMVGAQARAQGSALAPTAQVALATAVWAATVAHRIRWGAIGWNSFIEVFTGWFLWSAMLHLGARAALVRRCGGRLGARAWALVLLSDTLLLAAALLMLDFGDGPGWSGATALLYGAGYPEAEPPQWLWDISDIGGDPAGWNMLLFLPVATTWFLQARAPGRLVAPHGRT